MTSIPPVPLGHVIDASRPVLPYWRQVTDAQCSESHAHPRGQLIFASRGLTRVVTRRGIYLVPSHQAFWCPPGQEHMLVFPGAVDVANLFIDPQWAARLPAEQQVYDVPPLLRHLILKAVRVGECYAPASREFRLMEVIVDEMQQLQVSPLSLPWSEHVRLRPVLEAILDQPCSARGIDGWAQLAHVAPRTLARLFRQELNMTFGQWRLQVRLFYALERLYGGATVTAVALDLGYSTPSAFIAAFRRALGQSPAEYVAVSRD